MSETVLVSRRGPACFITLNRPERHNAFDDALIARLTEAFRDAATDERARVVVLDAVGKSFSAGADLGWMRRMADYDQARNLADSRALAQLMETIDTCPKPVIGVVAGAALGGGVGLVACCDMVVASHSASFCLSEVRLGLIPAVISPYVVAAIGARAARRYFQTAETIPAPRALALGLVSELAEPEELPRIRDRWIAQLAGNGPAAMNAAKHLVAHVAAHAAAADLRDWTARRIAELRASPEGREGMQAFLEKRKPAWIKE